LKQFPASKARQPNIEDRRNSNKPADWMTQLMGNQHVNGWGTQAAEARPRQAVQVDHPEDALAITSYDWRRGR